MSDTPRTDAEVKAYNCVRIDFARALEREVARLTSFLHGKCLHPDYEYETTKGARKAWGCHKPEGDGWEENKEEGRDGWERFEFHEECYWRRLKVRPNATQ